MTEHTLRVNEFFGPTFQGEGPFVGRLCHFLRLNRCNLHCHWCDTPYTWAHTEAKAALHDSGRVYDLSENESVLTTEDVNAWIRTNAVSFLVISGGEPLLQAKALNELIENMDSDITVQFETAGTLPPVGSQDGLGGWTVEDGVNYVVSPKLENSGNELSFRYKPDVLRQFVMKDANFKFVLTAPHELEEVCKIQKDVGIPSHKLWIMPEGTSVERNIEVARTLADPVIDQGFNLTFRNHILLWADERGR